jgi:hypothetical protein
MAKAPQTVDETAGEDQAEAQAPALCRVRCISELKPWATTHSKDGIVSRPLDLDEEVSVPPHEGQNLQKKRLAVIVG